jgi:hypothetical protein
VPVDDLACCKSTGACTALYGCMMCTLVLQTCRRARIHAWLTFPGSACVTDEWGVSRLALVVGVSIRRCGATCNGGTEAFYTAAELLGVRYSQARSSKKLARDQPQVQIDAS